MCILLIDQFSDQERANLEKEIAQNDANSMFDGSTR